MAPLFHHQRKTDNLVHPARAATGYRGNSGNFGPLAAAVAVHVIIAAGIILMPGVHILPKPDIPFITYAVPPEHAPPPPETPIEKAKSKTPSVSPVIPEIVTLRDPVDILVPVTPPSPPMPPQVNINPPVSPPVIIPPQIDQAYLATMQPPYPPSMIRAQTEGWVKVRVLVRPDGRVDAIELIDASDSAFWEATRNYAPKHWRLRPAMREGIPVSGEKILVIRFKLSDV